MRSCCLCWTDFIVFCRRDQPVFSKVDFTRSPSLSIVIPAYNESARIGHALEQVLQTVEEQNWQAEVLVVNDGSTDNTAQIVGRYAQSHPYLHLIENEGNRGKGYSVRHGILKAQGEIVMFTDADLSAPMTEARSLIDAIRQGADVAIGSRWLDRSRQTHHQPLYRRFFGRCFNGVTRLIMRLPFADTQCGFKAFRCNVAHTIFQLQRIERWGFDPELLFIAHKRGYRVVEVPVSWGHDERSRISYLRDGLQMLKELACIRWWSLLGVYDRVVDASIACKSSALETREG